MVFQANVLAACAGLLRLPMIVRRELVKVLAESDVAGVDATFHVLDNYADGQRIIAVEFSLLGDDEELRKAVGRLADAPASIAY